MIDDTFPVGCAFRNSIIYPNAFKGNPDHDHKIYGITNGIYIPGCDLENVMLPWGHDEYLYHIVKDESTLSDETLVMIRYHSFYPWHSADTYGDFRQSERKALP